MRQQDNTEQKRLKGDENNYMGNGLLLCKEKRMVTKKLRSYYSLAFDADYSRSMNSHAHWGCSHDVKSNE